MYRALYEYKTTLSRYLSFQAGDQFTVLDKSHKDWFLAQNGFGEIGYVPNNYLVKEQVTESEVLKSIDRAIEAIHYQATSTGGTYTHTQRQNLQQLLTHRKTVVETFKNERNAAASGVPTSPKRQAPEAPVSDSSQARVGPQTRSQSVKRSAPAPPTGSQNAAGEITQNCDDFVVVPALNDAEPQEEVFTVEPEEEVLTVDCATSPIKQQTKNKANGPDLKAISPVGIDCATSPFKFPPTKSDDDSAIGPENQSDNFFNFETIQLPENIGSELVEEVRRNTGLSYDKSGVAVETVLGHLGFRIPEISALLDRVYLTFQQQSSDVIAEEGSQDFVRLQHVFTELTACKDDSQQRGWALHEDESRIKGYLEELLSILENAKPSVCKRAIAQENYECVHNLVQYYQMELRVKLRLLMLQVFGAMCGLDSMVISLLLFSILTTELAEEMQANADDVQRLNYVSLVMAMLFSTGESVPANLHDHLNESFIHFVFDTIENPPTAEHEDQVTDLLVNLVLAFNLHFDQVKDNLVMKVLAEKGTVKVFTEKLLLLVNRGDDPVCMFEHEPQPPNSVMKFMQDLFSSKSTACLLYTNDAKVLIDIILGHLVDRSPGDKVRSSYLCLVRLLLWNSDYSEYKHRLSELDQCLCRIHEEEADTDGDKAVVAQILEEQHHLFTEG